MSDALSRPLGLQAICRYLLSPKTFLMFSVLLECIPELFLLGLLSTKACSEFFPVTIGVWLNPKYTAPYTAAETALASQNLSAIEDPTTLQDEGERKAAAEEILAILFNPFIKIKIQELRRKYQ